MTSHSLTAKWKLTFPCGEDSDLINVRTDDEQDECVTGAAGCSPNTLARELWQVIVSEHNYCAKEGRK